MIQERNASTAESAPAGRPPRLLLLSTNSAIGGVERIVVTLAREFTQLGWHVRTIFAGRSDTSSLLDWCRDQGVEAEANPAVLRHIDPHRVRDLLALRRLVAEARADVVHIHYGGNSISIRDIIAIRLAGARRCIVTVHHPALWSEDEGKRQLLTRVAAQLSAEVVVPSRAMNTILQQAGVSASKIQVIPNGLLAPTEYPTRANARRALGLPQDAFVVSALARLEREKGVQDLIEAMARVADPQGTMRLVVAGDGPQRQELEALAAAGLGARAIFLGRVHDTAEVYAASDVFALPSYMEGFGLVYVEAAFHGVPSIGTNVGGVPDAIIAGVTGLLVPPKDPAALAEAIVQLRDHPELRVRLGTAARARATTDLSMERMVEAYQHAYIPRRDATKV